MLSKEILGELKRVFSLNDYEVRLWICLLEKGESTAGELSSLSGVPRSRSYDTLENLEKKGFILSKVSKPMKYLSTHPQEVMETHKKKLRSKLEQQLEQVNNHKKTSTFNKIINLYTKKTESSLKENNSNINIRGRQNIHIKLASLFTDAKKQILINTNSGGLSRKNYEIIPALELAKKKNIDIKILSPDADTQHSKDYKQISQIKKSKNNDLRYSVIDEKNLVLITNSGTNNSQQENALLIENEYLSKEFQKIFEKNWK